MKIESEWVCMNSDYDFDLSEMLLKNEKLSYAKRKNKESENAHDNRKNEQCRDEDIERLS